MVLEAPTHGWFAPLFWACISYFLHCDQNTWHTQCKGRKDLIWLLVSVHGCLAPCGWTEEQECVEKESVQDRKEREAGRGQGYNVSKGPGAVVLAYSQLLGRWRITIWGQPRQKVNETPSQSISQASCLWSQLCWDCGWRLAPGKNMWPHLKNN
jgi:hypothetical protein